VARGT